MHSSSPMNVHLYKVVEPEGAQLLVEVLKKVSRLPLGKRLRTVGLLDMRLEDIQEPSTESAAWRLDFCKLRNQGPGKAGPGLATQSFDLQTGERFSEETAMVFDAVTGYATVQYNHYGPRAPAIADYLSMFLPQGLSYELLIQLDPTAQARLQRKKKFTRIAFRVAPARLSAAWRENNISMYKAIEAQRQTYGGDWVAVEVSLERRSSATLNLIDKVKGVLGLANEGDDVVTELVVTGRDADDDRVDVVNLLSGKLVQTYKRLPLDTGFRVSAVDRWIRLEDAMKTWRAAGIVS